MNAKSRIVSYQNLLALSIISAQLVAKIIFLYFFLFVFNSPFCEITKYFFSINSSFFQTKSIFLQGFFFVLCNENNVHLSWILRWVDFEGGLIYFFVHLLFNIFNFAFMLLKIHFIFKIALFQFNELIS